MKKILTSFGLYWHFILDILLTHIFVIAFLQLGFSTTAALLMSVDSILKITLSVFIAHIVMHYQPSVRYKISAILRFGLIGIWFTAISFLSFNYFSLLAIAPYLIFKFLMLIDSSLSADLVFAAHEKYQIDLSKSAASQNLVLRASTAFAPAVALILLTTPNTIIIALISAIAIGLFSTLLLRDMLFCYKDLAQFKKKEHSSSLAKLMANPLMRWGFVYQIVGNIAFAGVAFLFLDQLKLQSSVFLNEITVLYTAFLIAQSIVLIYGEIAVPIQKTSQITFVMGLCGLFVLLAGSVNTGVLRLFFCAGIGLTYSILLSGIQKVITSKLQGSGFIQYVGWSQTSGRLTSLTVTALLGFAISNGFSSEMLLMVSGLVGMICAVILSFMSSIFSKSRPGVEQVPS